MNIFFSGLAYRSQSIKLKLISVRTVYNIATEKNPLMVHFYSRIVHCKVNTCTSSFNLLIYLHDNKITFVSLQRQLIFFGPFPFLIEKVISFLNNIIIYFIFKVLLYGNITILIFAYDMIEILCLYFTDKFVRLYLHYKSDMLN